MNSVLTVSVNWSSERTPGLEYKFGSHYRDVNWSGVVRFLMGKLWRENTRRLWGNVGIDGQAV